MKLSDDSKGIVLRDLFKKGRILDKEDISDFNKIVTIKDYVDFLLNNTTKYWYKIQDERNHE